MLCSSKIADVFEVLRGLAKKTNPVVITQKEIARQAGVGLVCCSIALRKFRENGFIRRIHGDKRIDSDSYLVNLNYNIKRRSKVVTKWRCEIFLGGEFE
jgi:DNA-binding IclR family transcriptional regulator